VLLPCSGTKRVLFFSFSRFCYRPTSSFFVSSQAHRVFLVFVSDESFSLLFSTSSLFSRSFFSEPNVRLFPSLFFHRYDVREEALPPLFSVFSSIRLLLLPANLRAILFPSLNWSPFLVPSNEVSFTALRAHFLFFFDPVSGHCLSPNLYGFLSSLFFTFCLLQRRKSGRPSAFFQVFPLSF